MKSFIFGRSNEDERGKPDERGEVRIDAPDLVSARDAFGKEVEGKGAFYRKEKEHESHNIRDARLYIVRLALGGEAPPERARKRKG